MRPLSALARPFAFRLPLWLALAWALAWLGAPAPLSAALTESALDPSLRFAAIQPSLAGHVDHAGHAERDASAYAHPAPDASQIANGAHSVAVVPSHDALSNPTLHVHCPTMGGVNHPVSAAAPPGLAPTASPRAQAALLCCLNPDAPLALEVHGTNPTPSAPRRVEIAAPPLPEVDALAIAELEISRAPPPLQQSRRLRI